MSWITSLPVDIIIDIIARVPRRYYPTLSLVSKLFRSVIASHHLYVSRSLLDRTEYCVYVTISRADNSDGGDRLYTLRSNSSTNTHCLVPITLLPLIPTGGSYVAVDSKIFVIGGPQNENLSPAANALFIDCRFHTAQHLPCMPSEIASSVFKTIDEKIYIGECEITSPPIQWGFIKVDAESGTRLIMKPDLIVCKWVCNSVVAPDKVYFKTLKNCFVYDPDEDKWDKDEILNSKTWANDDNKCVIEGIPSCYYLRLLGILLVYDPKEIVWKVVKGVGILTEDAVLSRTMIYGGKVVVLLQKQVNDKNEIWCAEIKVERDKEEEICGRVEWCGCVLQGHWIHFKNCFVVRC